YTVVPLLSFTFILKGMNYMFSLGLHYVKKTRYNAYIVSVVAILNILLNIVLIPEIGIYGAAITTIISNIVMVMAFYHYSQKFYYINFELKRLYILFSVGTLWLLGGFLSDWYLESVWSALVIKVLLFISFPFILSLLRFFEKIEVENLSGAWKKWSKPSRWIENIKKFEKH
ncbi:MAG: polysaccharide biosynthesis C-terminal domain-containing protein, partial [Bacteroidota bacterium]|nr:polysaccharide biosynthesis C-terminal domain-containing protein [Bacteroidota bacterium]